MNTKPFIVKFTTTYFTSMLNLKTETIYITGLPRKNETTVQIYAYFLTFMILFNFFKADDII